MPHPWGQLIRCPKSQVPLMLASHNMDAKSQLASLKKPLKYGRLSLKSYMQKYLRDLGSELGLAFCSTQLATSLKPHLQKMLPCTHSCHTWNLGLRTLCEMLSPSFHALNG